MNSQESISILGAGWLGAPLGAALAKKGWLVKGSTTSSEKLSPLRNLGIDSYLLVVDKKLKGDRINDFFKSDILLINIPPGRRQSNVEQRFLRQIELIAKEAEFREVKNILFVSSTSVYGKLEGLVDETDLPQPHSGSGKALLKAEEYLKDKFGSKLSILRPAGLIGGDRRPGRWFAGKKDLPDGNVPVNLIHRIDCINIINQIVQKKIWGELFNLCADEHPIKKKFYPHQAKKDGLEPPTYQASNISSGKIISNKKIKTSLDYQFQFPDPMDF